MNNRLVELLARKRQELKDVEAVVFRLQGATTALVQSAQGLRRKHTDGVQRAENADLEARWNDALKAGGSVAEAVRNVALSTIEAIAKDLEATAQNQAQEGIRAEGRKQAIATVISELAGVSVPDVPEPAVASEVPANGDGESHAGAGTRGGAEQ